MTERSIGANVPLLAVSTYGRAGASTRVRLYDWLDHCELSDTRRFSYLGTANNQFSTLAKRPAAVAAAEFELRRLANHIGDSHIVISKQASPFSSGGIEQRLLENSAHSAYDFDDALMHDTQSLVRRIWSKQKLWARAVQAANVVIAGSSILAEQASLLNNNVTIIPSCIEPRNYVAKRAFEFEGTPVGVWIGSPSTERFLMELAEPLLDLNSIYGLRIKVISAGASSLGALDRIVDRVAWSEETFARELSRGDFGVMPLNDTPFTRGKCSYKLLQYAATGMPLVGSPVGANNEALTKLGGFSATSPQDWKDSIETIIDMGASERAKYGATALKGVRDYYSFDAWEEPWLEAVGANRPSIAD